MNKYPTTGSQFHKIFILSSLPSIGSNISLISLRNEYKSNMDLHLKFNSHGIHGIHGLYKAAYVRRQPISNPYRSRAVTALGIYGSSKYLISSGDS